MQLSTGICLMKQLLWALLCAVEVSAAPMQPFPTLLKGSVMVDIGSEAGKHGKMIHPLDHYAVMGYPVNENGVGPFPPSLMQSLSWGEMRRLTGNAMHVAAIGTWLHFVLAVAQQKVEH